MSKQNITSHNTDMNESQFEIKKWAMDMAMAMAGGDTSPQTILDTAKQVYDWVSGSPEPSHWEKTSKRMANTAAQAFAIRQVLPEFAETASSIQEMVENHHLRCDVHEEDPKSEVVSRLRKKLRQVKKKLRRVKRSTRYTEFISTMERLTDLEQERDDLVEERKGLQKALKDRKASNADLRKEISGLRRSYGDLKYERDKITGELLLCKQQKEMLLQDRKV